VTIKKTVTIIVDNCTLIVKMVDSCTIVLVVASPLVNTLKSINLLYFPIDLRLFSNNIIFYQFSFLWSNLKQSLWKSIDLIMGL
jgi:hypothetical protein